MRRQVQLLGFGIVFLLLLVLSAPLIVPKRPIERLLTQVTEELLARPVHIEHLRFHALPLPYVEVARIVVPSNGDPDESFLDLVGVRAYISPLPLILGRVEITRITAFDGHLRLTRLSDGSFADIGLPRIERPGHHRARVLSRARVSLRDIEITLVDRYVLRDGESLTRGTIRHLHTSVPEPFTPFHFEAEVQIPSHESTLWLSGTISGSPTRRDRASAPGAPSHPVSLRVRTQNLRTSVFVPYLPRLAPLLPPELAFDVSLTGDLTANVAVEGEIELSPKVVMQLSGVFTMSADPARMGLEVVVDRLSLEDVLLAVPAFSTLLPSPASLIGYARLRARLAGPIDDPRLAASLQSKRFRAKAGSLNGGEREVGGVHLDSRDIVLTLTGRGLAGTSPRFAFNAEAHDLVLDVTLPATRLERRFWVLDSVLLGSVSATKGRFARLEFEDLRLRFRLSPESSTLRTSMGAHGGTIHSRLFSKAIDDGSSHRLHIRGADMNAGSLTSAFSSSGDPLVRGSMTADLALEFTDLRWDGFSESASGEGMVEILDARVAPLELEAYVAEALEQVAEQNRVLPPEELIEPSLGSFSGRFFMAEGTVEIPIAELKKDTSRTLIGGRLDIDGSLLFEGCFAFSKDASRRLGAVGRLLKTHESQLFIPFSLVGSLDEPVVVLDMKALLERAASGSSRSAERAWRELLLLLRDQSAGPSGGS